MYNSCFRMLPGALSQQRTPQHSLGRFCDVLVAGFLLLCWGITTCKYQIVSSCDDSLSWRSIPAFPVECTAHPVLQFLNQPGLTYMGIVNVPGSESWMLYTFSATTLWLVLAIMLSKDQYAAVRTPQMLIVRLLPKATALATMLLQRGPVKQISYYPLYCPLDGLIIVWYTMFWRVSAGLNQ